VIAKLGASTIFGSASCIRPRMEALVPRVMAGSVVATELIGILQKGTVFRKLASAPSPTIAGEGLVMDARD
jgi:hypothetical protein